MPRSFLVKKQEGEGEAEGSEECEVMEGEDAADDGLEEEEKGEIDKNKEDGSVINAEKQDTPEEVGKKIEKEDCTVQEPTSTTAKKKIIKIVISKGENKTVNLQNNKSKSGKKSFPCDSCGKVFSAQYTLSRHLPVHTGVRKFQCDICGKSFRQASTLCRHKVIHSDKLGHECKVCSKSFNRSSTLIAHMKTHNPVKVFECDICGKAFHQKGNLKNHIYTHTGERPYHCPCCNRSFNQHSNLAFHLQQAHEDEKLLSCHVCQQKFQKKYELRKHEVEVHDIVYPPKDPPRYMLNKEKNSQQSMQEDITRDQDRRELNSEQDFLNTEVLAEETNNNEDTSENSSIHPEIVNLQKTSLIMFKFDQNNHLQVVAQQSE